MSPPIRAFRTPLGEDEQTSELESAAKETHGDRRAHSRQRDQDLQWIRNARLTAGHGVSIIDLSSGGVLLDSPVPLRPDSVMTLEIGGRGIEQRVRFRVLRCQIGALQPGRTVYRGACQFITPIEWPADHPGGARILYPGAFVGLDLALKQIVERTGPDGSFGSMDRDLVRQELDALRIRALTTPLDPIANPLAELLAAVIPALDRNEGFGTLVERIESELRHTIPQMTLRLTDRPESASDAVKSILVNAPGGRFSSALVSVDLPRGVVLNAWQSRVLRAATRLLGLLQRLESESSESFATVGCEPPAVAPSRSQARTTDLISASGWQRIVVRYAEGQILKGFTQDFSPNRSQFSLWPSVDAAPQDRVIVPLARLKGVFFVRDFAGNPGYIERTDSDHPQHGRRIEVTLVDDEVIVGRTLTYRPEGYGFFVIPADPLANNQRIFVVGSAVRQVRFP